jgi:mannose-6-phosphate isomerase-like protein (cupin superfamily)
MESNRILFEQIEWQSPQVGLRVKAFREGKTQLRLVEISAGFEEPVACHKGHIGMVLSGELEIDFAGRIVRFPENSALLIPAGSAHAHKARAITPLVRLFLVEEVSD